MPTPEQPATPLPEPLSLATRQRNILAITGSILVLAGLYSLLGQRQNGVATLAVLLSGGLLILVGVVGQVPGTIWTRFTREASNELRQLQNFRSHLEEDEVMRNIAQVAATERARLTFRAGPTVARWNAVVVGEHREVGILYVGPDDPFPDYFPWVVDPSRSSAVLVIFNNDKSQDDRWAAVERVLQTSELQIAHLHAASVEASSGTLVSVCGPAFADLYEHLDALVFDRIGGSQQTTDIAVISRPTTTQ